MLSVLTRTFTQPIKSFLRSCQFERSNCPFLEAGRSVTIDVVLQIAQPETSSDPTYTRTTVSPGRLRWWELQSVLIGRGGGKLRRGQGAEVVRTSGDGKG